MSKKSIAGGLGIIAYCLSGLWLFTPDYDDVPDGFTLSGEGKLLWNESTQTLTVIQESNGVLTITAPEIPNIVHRSTNPGEKLLMRVMNGNPSSISGLLKSSGAVMIINPNGMLLGEGAVIDIPAPLTLSTLEIDPDDFTKGGDNRFRGSNGATDYGTVEVNGETILLGNFIDSPKTDNVIGIGAGGDLIIVEKPEKTTAFKFDGLQPVKK